MVAELLEAVEGVLTLLYFAGVFLLPNRMGVVVAVCGVFVALGSPVLAWWLYPEQMVFYTIAFVYTGAMFVVSGGVLLDRVWDDMLGVGRPNRVEVASVLLLALGVMPFM